MNRKRTKEIARTFFHHKLLLSAVLLAIVFVSMLLVRMMPPSETEIRRSACLVEGRSELCMASGADTIVLRADSVNQQGVWINKHWWWPSCDGRVLTIAQGIRPQMKGRTFSESNLPALLQAVTDSMGRLVERKDVERKELEYYLRSHGVQDEGYTRIAHYSDLQKIETDSLKQVYKLWKAFKPSAHMKLVHRYRLRVLWFNNDDQLEQTACLPLVSDLSRQGEPIIVHTMKSMKPWGAYAVRKLIWGGSDHKQVMSVTLVPQDSTAAHHALLTTGIYTRGRQHNIPALFARDGSPVFTKYGQFIGIISQKEVK